MTQAVKIDWISVTIRDVPVDIREQVESVGQLGAGMLYEITGHIGPWSESEKGAYGYTNTAKAECGTSVLYSVPISGNGIHIRYPGSSLGLGLSELEFHHKQGHAFTRIDIATDVKLEQPFDIGGWYSMAECGKAKTKAKKTALMISDTGKTLYVGSRTSEKYLRIYDKGGEQGGEQGVWLRAELEVKGRAANRLVDEIFRRGLNIIPSAINGFCSFEGDVWGNWLGSDIERIPSERKETDTRAWLLDIPAKALARLVVSGDREVKRAFDAAVARHVGQELGDKVDAKNSARFNRSLDKS
jgi:hypothetical protein